LQKSLIKIVGQNKVKEVGMVLPFHIVTRLDDAFHGQAEVKRAIGIAIAAGINNTGVTPRH
jgi:hypothetical protein